MSEPETFAVEQEWQTWRYDPVLLQSSSLLTCSQSIRSWLWNAHKDELSNHITFKYLQRPESIARGVIFIDKEWAKNHIHCKQVNCTMLATGRAMTPLCFLKISVLQWLILIVVTVIISTLVILLRTYTNCLVMSLAAADSPTSCLWCHQPFLCTSLVSVCEGCERQKTLIRTDRKVCCAKWHNGGYCYNLIQPFRYSI